jgi:DnaA regulatory inactivator Hda
MGNMIQLVMPLNTPHRFVFDNLVVHEGIEQALATIRSVYGAPSGPFPPLFLYGTAGTGKTHILRAASALFGVRTPGDAPGIEYVPLMLQEPEFRDLQELVSHFDELAPRGVAVDDIHLLDQDGMIHLWTLSNKLTRAGLPLMLASRRSLEEVFTDNEHLISRVHAGLVFHLEPPSDGVRLLILDKMARDRNVRLSSDVSRYLVTRKSRNVKDLDTILDLLDQASLEQGRRITIPFVRSLEQSNRI